MSHKKPNTPTLLILVAFALAVGLLTWGCPNPATQGDVERIVQENNPTDPAPDPARVSAAWRATIAGLVVQFTDLSSGDPVRWDWDFGDLTAGSSRQNPLHTYAAAGTYEVRLQACSSVDDSNCSEAPASVTVAP